MRLNIWQNVVSGCDKIYFSPEMEGTVFQFREFLITSVLSSRLKIVRIHLLDGWSLYFIWKNHFETQIHFSPECNPSFAQQSVIFATQQHFPATRKARVTRATCIFILLLTHLMPRVWNTLAKNAGETHFEASDVYVVDKYITRKKIVG